MTSTIDRAPRIQDRPTAVVPPSLQKVGGVAALYLAVALLGAIPYFLLVVDYPSATTAADQVALVVANYGSMYAVYLATYVLFGMAVAVLALALHDGLAQLAPFAVRVATAVGLLWSFALVTSGLVFTYGMTTVVDLHETDAAQAVQAWQGIGPVAMALGGAGGEVLGGLWVLLLSVVALRTRALPKALVWLGLLIGVVGLASVVPPLHNAAVAFGLLQIAWFLSLAWILLRSRGTRGLVRGEDRTADVRRRKASLPPRWFVVLFWHAHRALVRLTHGRVGLWRPKPDGWGALWLTTTGRRTGQPRRVLVGYFEDGDRLVTMAMNGWGAAEPAWWLNLQAHPDATAQTKDGARAVHARRAQGAERDRLWARWAEIDKDLDAYAARRPTETAVVVFEPR